MGTALLMADVSAGAAQRLREVCERLDPWRLGWASPAGEECARLLALERAAIAGLAGDLEALEASLRRGRVDW